ncbi:diaminopimelate epimerase [Bacteroides sp. 224]|uniref:diaminopimelate epimerase n=1 Tax=Bacteroides sp. 224 TaxID=2302936 RepID=UPI0013D09B46|nr:diaminopimelate epimerase [Bacteroides sp. 224]NDV64602.1 diaminopimelate epimerase [Bacteroides sp. 224]
MTKEIRFTKMHGAGNDYIYVDIRKECIPHPEQTSILWSDRNKGIGGDGLVLIGSSDIANYSMRIFNADGSEATMCGNASRCVAKYLYDNGDIQGNEFSLETLSGIKYLKLNIEKNEVASVTVDMNEPSDIQEIEIKLSTGHQLTGTTVNMGNPHLVIFVDDISEINLPVLGPQIEHHPLFPGRVNVEFAQVLSPNKIRMRVWERGSGITLACGTGACATAVAAIQSGKTKRKPDVIMDGGTLTIEWNKETNHIMMTGPATKVFDGKIEINQ